MHWQKEIYLTLLEFSLRNLGIKSAGSLNLCKPFYQGIVLFIKIIYFKFVTSSWELKITKIRFLP
jgi:hypothetical protein